MVKRGLLCKFLIEWLSCLWSYTWTSTHVHEGLYVKDYVYACTQGLLARQHTKHFVYACT